MMDHEMAEDKACAKECLELRMYCVVAHSGWQKCYHNIYYGCNKIKVTDSRSVFFSVPLSSCH